MVRNPAGLYGGGAFLVDTTPIVNLVAKKRAQDEAKKTALTKYFTDLSNKATATGIRNQELPAYTQSVDNYKNYWLKNSEDILNGDVAKQMEAQRLANLPLKIAQESKNLRTIDVDVAKNTLSNPDAKDRWTDQTRVSWDKHEQPRYIVSGTGEIVENPNHETLDLTAMTFNPKLLSESEMQEKADKQVDDIKAKQLGAPSIKEYKADPYKQLEITSYGHDKNNLAAIGQRYRELFKDPSISFTFNKRHPLSELNEQNLPELAEANKLFKDIYGKDIETNEDLYVAKNMYQKSLPKTEQKLIENKAYAAKQSEASQIRVKKAGEKGELSAQDIAKVKTPFEQIPNMSATTSNGEKIQIKDGYVFDQNGKPYSSPEGQYNIKITKSNIPSSMLKGLPKGVNSLLIDNMDFSVKNGVIQSANNEYTGIIDRDELLKNELKRMGVKNAGQLILNKADYQVEKTQKKNVPSSSKVKKVVIKGLALPK